MNEFLKAALAYHKDFNFSIIPLNPSIDETKAKKPLIKWEEFQKRRASEDEITTWWNRWPNAMIGIVCGKISGIFVLDADSEEAKEKLDSIFPDSFVCPIVRTPRPGYHFWLKHQGKIRNSNNGLIHVRGEGGYVVVPPSRKDDGSEYKFIVEPSKDCPLPPPAPPLLLNKILNDMQGLEKRKNIEDPMSQMSQTVTNVTNIFTEGRRDEDLFHHAYILFKGGMSKGDVSQTIDFLARNSIPPYPISEARCKVESAFQRFLSRNDESLRNISSEVENWVRVTTGHFRVTNLYQDVTIVTKEGKHAARQTLLRLKKEGIIEKIGNENGVYRLIENQVNDINIFEESEKALNVKYPLNLESLVYTMPKSIIIVAGESDSGKTAFLLNFSFLNLDTHAIIYYSSEMGPTELRSRIEKFDRPLTDWRKVKFKERGKDFQDVIEPDKINIIDYLELTDDFYRVGGQIKSIFDKLKTGIAIIALQKKIGQSLARGGDFTMEKARLYLSLDRDNYCKILKAKNWVNPMLKPTGKQRKYALYQGCKFFSKSEWEMEESND